ncbi:hypothetical protein Q5424_02705 [Conexibacter sp. JD483]|uniref:hypothetical protein n=1 Tax=unclassified Conexibacter TaxID=2627773 RepID=UPI00272818D5|nr:MULTISPECIES: hypothetical protein [unclassified Conexibacter]MDO8184065.1 hypothetical protein [Conexibacter sp. CPCC 205706]MDO8197057.1 hypothetical protein [Conexibacter sp. CPCC 205762]MDR9367973.1 hypothetical protein [Conexibacter sp. JD483]
MASPTSDSSISPATGASARPAATELLLRHGPLLVLAAWTALMTAVLLHFSFDSRLATIDESNAVLLGRFIDGDFANFLQGNVARGPERLTSWLAWLTVLATDDPTKQYQLLHVLTALAQSLVVVPVWLAARELGLGRWQALAPALIASSGSFAFYGTTTLNTTVGTLSCGLMLWAMLRSLRRPGWRGDLLVLATLALTVIARIGWAPLVGAIAPAALATIWFGRPDGERLAAWLKALPKRLLTRHPLLSAGAIALLLALLVVGTGPLVGGEQYGGVRLHPQIELSVLWDNTRTLFSHLAIGTAIVPFVLALPLLLRSLWKPADAVEGGFAWLVAGYAVIFSYAYYFSMNEDRYFAVLAAPFVLAGALAVFKKPPPLWSIAVSGVAVTWLVASSYEWPPGDVYRYFIAPTSQFFGDVVLGKLSQRIGFGRELWAVLATAVAAAVAVGLVLVALRAFPRRVKTAVVVVAMGGLLVFQLAATWHPAKKFTNVVGMKDVPRQQLEFIDEAVDAYDPGEAISSSEPLAVDGTIHPDVAAQMAFLQVFNRSLGYRFSVGIEGDGTEPPPGTPPAQAEVDWRTGKVDLEGRAVPDVILTSSGQSTVGFDSELLRSPPLYPWAGLEHPRMPLRIEWLLRGALPDRFGDPANPMRLRVFPHGDERCLSGIVNTHPLTDRVLRFRLTGGPRVIRGSAAPGQPAAFRIRLRDRPTTLTLHSGAARLADGSERSPALFNLQLQPCTR